MDISSHSMVPMSQEKVKSIGFLLSSYYITNDLIMVKYRSSSQLIEPQSGHWINSLSIIKANLWYKTALCNQKQTIKYFQANLSENIIPFNNM